MSFNNCGWFYEPSRDEIEEIFKASLGEKFTFIITII